VAHLRRLDALGLHPLEEGLRVRLPWPRGAGEEGIDVAETTGAAGRGATAERGSATLAGTPTSAAAALSVEEMLLLVPEARLGDLTAYVRILRDGGYPEDFVAREVETRVFGPRVEARRALAREVEEQARKAEGPLPRETAGLFVRARVSSGSEDLSTLADEVLAAAKKLRLPRELLEEAREDLSKAFTVEPPLARALVKKVLDEIEVEIRKKLRRGRKVRDPYLTHPRKRLLVLVAKEPGRTCDLAKRAGVSWVTAHRRLRGLAKRKLIERRGDGVAEPKVWYVTHAGTKVFDEIPEVRHKMIEGFDRILGILDERRQVRDELRAFGWRYDQCRDVLPYYTVDHLKREILEARQAHGAWDVKDPGRFLWDRLGAEPMAKRRARIEAAVLFTDPKTRIAYVEAAMEKAKLDRFERRKQGLARKIVPQGAGAAYLDATKDEPFYLSLWLAFSLRSRGRKGHQVTAGDVHGILAWIHKQDAKRRRPAVQETGESRYRPKKE